MYCPKSKLFNRREFERELERSSEQVALFRDTIQAGRLVLRQHEAGTTAPTIVHHHAWLIDRILHYAWQVRGAGLSETPIALVAVGGYGRSELHPYSDIDLMLLLEKDHYEQVQDFVATFLSFLWDIGLEVGHSVRSLRDCVAAANQDITVATNIMESRYLEGNRKLVETMQSRTASNRIWKPTEFFNAKLAEQQARHRKYDDSAYDLEPNIKEGPGGLRDLQTVIWVLKRRYGITELKQLIETDYLTAEEYRQLVRGRNFLWKLRIGLHYTAGRCEDRLLFDHQRMLAAQFGYRDNANHLGVEQLMKRYYRTVKDLRLLNEILLQHYEEENSFRRASRVKPINERFQSYTGYLETRHENVFKQHPHAILELFFLLQQHSGLKGIRANAIRQLRGSLYLIDNRFRNDPHCKRLFMRIMRQPSGITHALRRMNAYGVLGSYIPVFGGVVGQMQHDLFHAYTVDAHSLFVVRNLRRFAIDTHADEFPLANRAMSRIDKPERLYLAGLFHDVAKGRGGDHSVLGGKDALQFCKRHDMSNFDARFVGWLVRHHLLMSHTAQRKDITDPNVVRAFAKSVGDQEHLNNLYLLTIADIRGTSPNVWNAWKGRLLEDLYHAATRFIRHGLSMPQDTSQRVSDIRAAVRAQLDDNSVNREQLASFWDSLPTDYFLRHSSDDLTWHVESISSSRAIDLPLVAVRFQPRLDALVFLIYAPESEQLLSLVTKGLERMNLNIADAKIHASTSGFALYTFAALEEGLADCMDQSHVAHLKSELRNRIIHDTGSDFEKVYQLPRKLKHFSIEPRVDFSQSTHHTVMEVIALDQPGLLHRVSRCLLHCKVHLVTAKIATFGERVEDVFFVTDRDGNAVTSPEQLECLRSNILAALTVPNSKQANKAASA
ncbi:MAG: Bifunctional uridylyltransferase/uridylyl-removing enzyme [Gammaproteobacteria bacterium]|nr:Bifunctional uridylyltransferase/uridylyl-removing enzyme [Gammaproteobacteria bacterium]